MLRCLILFTLAALCAATDSPDGPFDKAGLEALLRKDHSQKISNIYDPDSKTQCAAQLLRRRKSCALTVFALPWQVHMGRREPRALSRCRW